MHPFLHLTSFKIYNVFLLFVFSVVVNNNLPSLFSTAFYCIFYLFIIYLGIYYYRKALFLLYFIYGLLLDILLLNEIGPHLFTFIIILFLLNFFVKFLYNLSSIKVYFLIIVLQILMIFFQMIISTLIFNINFNSIYFAQIVILTILLSYPSFLFFSRLDQFK